MEDQTLDTSGWGVWATFSRGLAGRRAELQSGRPRFPLEPAGGGRLGGGSGSRRQALFRWGRWPPTGCDFTGCGGPSKP